MKNKIFQKNKKAQIAMEFVHTYGWVMLSVVVLGGAAIYYNLQSNKQIIPLECTMFAGISCIDADVLEENQLVLELVNGFGFAISNITANVTGTCNSTANTSDGNPFFNPSVILANQQVRLIFECQNLSGMTLEENIKIGYINVESGRKHTKIGKLQYSPTGK